MSRIRENLPGMRARTLAASLVLLCGCTTRPAPSPPPAPPVAAEPPEALTPAYDPTAVVAGVYRLDLAAGLDALGETLTADDRAQEAAEVRDELAAGSAWLVVDPGGETLLVYGPQAESMQVDALSVALDPTGFDLALQELPDRASARCRAMSEVRLECDLELAGGDFQAPLPMILERASAADPGLPEPGIYGWEPALGLAEFADVDSMQDSLVSSGVEPVKARALAQELLSRPSLNIIDGDSLWTLSDAISWSEGKHEARIERVVFPPARMERTSDGFRIERRMPASAGAIVEDCRLMDAGFACRSGGRDSIYQRRVIVPAT